jgi:hypothetical protein
MIPALINRLGPRSTPERACPPLDLLASDVR